MFALTGDDLAKLLEGIDLSGNWLLVAAIAAIGFLQWPRIKGLVTSLIPQRGEIDEGQLDRIEAAVNSIKETLRNKQP